MLKLANINKSYDKRNALKEVSMEVASGVCYGIVGPNGAGKSTLLKIITSVIRDYEGEVTLNKKDLKKIRSTIGYVPQEICLESSISAIDNLYFFGKLYGLKGTYLKNRANEILELIGLSKRKKDKVRIFSGGMKRRLNIGCALMHEPTLIILDEPTVGIDPQSRHYIFELIRNLQQAGSTIIYASHYMEEVETLCDEVMFLDHGEIIEQGRIDHLLQKYTDPSIFMKGSKALITGKPSGASVKEENGGYVLTGDNPLLIMEEIIHQSLKNHYNIERLELIRPRLEDVFFDLTGSELRA